MARPKGSYTRPQIRDYIKGPEIKELTRLAVERAKAGDSTMHKFLLEQIYGKAPQPITGEDGGAIKINIVQYGNNDTIELPTEDLSTSVTKLPEQIQDSGVAQKKRKIKNRIKRPDKKDAA